MIRVRGMHKSYRTGKIVTPVLRGVDLEIEDGEMVSIVGPSGSGKSTLLHAIGGLDRDFEGTIEVDGRNLQSLSDVALSDYRNRHVGFVFQTFNLLPHQTCVENVALPALFARGQGMLSPQQALTRARDVLERVDLSDKLDARPTMLSGGQRQRVAIARALFNRPQLMLCDEPTGNLDSAMGTAILELFARLNEQDGITVVIVTHDPRIAASTGRSVKVHDGLVLEVETAAEPAPTDGPLTLDEDRPDPDDSVPDDHTTASELPLLEYAGAQDGGPTLDDGGPTLDEGEREADR